MTPDTTFISACYIVKDEEEFLDASLRAVAPFADEVVVYDTGSSDRTVEIARAAGAHVVEGYWDDDFGAARNRALEHCRGEWVLSVDADEVVQGDPRAWRRSLHLASFDAFGIEVLSSSYVDGGAEHRAMVGRVLRRSQCRWEGVLHEMLVHRWRDGLLRLGHNDTVSLRHYGYSAVHIAERNKGARNLALAEAALRRARDKGIDDVDDLLINVGRSATLAGEHRKALCTYAELDIETISAGSGVLVGPSVLISALALQDFRTADRWLACMERWGENENVCAGLKSQIAMARGDWAQAEELIRGLEDAVSRSSAQFRVSDHTDNLITCVARQGRGVEAAELLIEHVATGRSGLSAVSALLLAAEAPDGVRRLAEALPAPLDKPFIGQLQKCRADVTDEFFTRLWDLGRARTAVVVAVQKQWPTLTFESALTWSLRFREAGLAEYCPLRLIAVAAGQRDTLTRILCAGVLYEIGDHSVVEVLERMLASVPDDEVPVVVEALRGAAPQLAASLVPA